MDLAEARVWLERGSGRASSDRFLTLPSRRVRVLRTGDGVDVLGLLCRKPVEPGQWIFGEPLFVRARVGKGRFFYLGADLGQGLSIPLRLAPAQVVFARARPGE